ncbi:MULTISPECIES: trypsin-like serine protease [Amycolatopsis]|uniref:trypsin-like serine protease n=1 Tax=Amycolatopsis TaxID=1813 RepID=UPI00174964B2
MTSSKLIVALLAVATVALTSSNVPPASDARTTKVAAQPDSYPFNARFVTTTANGTTGGVCSGALASPQWAITAGHCFHDAQHFRTAGAPRYPTSVTVGTADLKETSGHLRQVVEVHQSPVNDIALAKLAQPILGIRPAMLSTTAPHVDQQLTFAGWGAVLPRLTEPAAHLHLGTVSVATTAATTFGVHGLSPSAATSACLFDSGAPYLSQPFDQQPAIVTGIEVGGPACPHTSTETVARVDVLNEWVHRIVDEDTSPRLGPTPSPGPAGTQR